MTDPENPLLIPRYKAKDLAKAVADGGIAHSTASARIANYAKGEHVHFRGVAGSGAVNSAKLYSLADVCVAVMLSSFQDCGVAEQELLTLAGISLYAWDVPSDDERLTHPIMQAALDTFDGEPWFLQMDFYRNPNEESRTVQSVFYRCDSEPVYSSPRPSEDDGWRIVGRILISTDCLARLERYLRVDTKAN